MPNTSRQFLPWLFLLFVGSGCAALIYEVVWFQLLQLVIGSSAVSLGVLLGTFMGGMGLGSLALSRVIASRRHPFRVYALLELGIGVLGIAVLFVVPVVARFYALNAGPGLTGIMLRGVVCAVCLLPPTLLMGATLPAIARWIQATPRGVSWLGVFYGGNITGAVFGSLLAGFYLLRVHDMATATLVAATINGIVALISLALAAKTAPHSQNLMPVSEPMSAPSNDWPVFCAIALSGLCALGAEVIWTRLLSLMLGQTVYTFSIILAVFLGGLGIGSSVGSLLARWIASPRLALGCCQMLLAVAMTWTAWIIARSLPYWPINPSLSRGPWVSFQLDIVRCLWAILPPACLWGASFPLALASVATGVRDPARLVGRVYAANTLGAIVGALGCSILLIAWAGTQRGQQALIGLSILAALIVWVSLLWPSWTGSRTGSESWNVGKRIGSIGSILAMAWIAAGLAMSVPQIPWELVAYGRYQATYDDDKKILYVGEGMNATVAVTEMQNGVRNFHVSGKVEASTESKDMRLQRMLGHIPALFHPKPRSVLIVGCGAGVTAGSFVVHPSMERIVICEIEPLIPKVVAGYFGKENYNVVKDPRVTIVYDDARHYILTTPEKFDIITSDPIHPWVKGAATLYTREYFELCKRHLNPGGLVTQWVPLYESDAAVVKSEMATFFDVFPGGTVWGNDNDGEGYDVVMLGQVGGLTIDVDKLQHRLRQDDRVAQSLKDVGFTSGMGLLTTYAGQGPDLKRWLQNAEINEDRNLRLQYLAGMGLNLSQSGMIYQEMTAYRRYPTALFTGSEQHLHMVKVLFERAKSGQ